MKILNHTVGFVFDKATVTHNLTEDSKTRSAVFNIVFDIKVEFQRVMVGLKKFGR